MANKIKKMMTFSIELYEQVEKKANKVGVPFQEYVRHLIINDLDSYIGPTEYVDDETAKEIKKGIDDMRAGRYITIDPRDRKALRKALS